MKYNHQAGSKKSRLRDARRKPNFPHNSIQSGKDPKSKKTRVNTGRNTHRAENVFPHNSDSQMRENRNLSPKTQNDDFPLDKHPRGHPATIKKHEYPQIRGRAEHYRIILSQPIRTSPNDQGQSLWGRMREQIVNAKSAEEIRRLLEKHEGHYRSEYFPGLSRLILKTVKEKKFPKRLEAQANFLADSIAALGRVSPKRSRDICEAQRKINQEQKGETHAETSDSILNVLGHRFP